MKRAFLTTATVALLAATTFSWAQAPGDFEVTGPDGRRILLKADKTWTYLPGEPAKEEDKPTFTGEAVLTLERMEDAGQNCRLGFRMRNDTNQEIRNIVPRFVVYRTSGVAYESRTLAFYSINPGNSVARETLFRGIACNEIGRVQVTGGDRCVMGELDRFSYSAGVCLERVRVSPSERVRFDK